MKYTLIISFIFAISVHARRQRPLQDATNPGQNRYICDECVPKELIQAPGIGFDLSSSYATVAIRYPNQTIVDVGRFNGSEEYADLLVRLGPPYVYNGPPFDTISDRIRYDLEQASRKWRKLRGLPSTTDIELFSSFLINVTDFASYSLDTPVTRVAISLPDLPNLSYEDWEEVVQLTGLDVLKSYRFHQQRLRELNVAWVGLGHGVCEHWRDSERCDKEERSMEKRVVLALSFTEERLSISKAFVSGASEIYVATQVSRQDLGYLSWRSNPENETFWDSVGMYVGTVARTDRGFVIQDLILTGEHAEEKNFLDAVWKALGDVTDVQKLWQPLQVPGFDAEFVAARGAAELAKRWQAEPPYGCMEGDWCKDDGGPDVKQEL
ncbi:hypothetical protein VTL71DRAFT_8409 [Oculimacula yallundae]|uniref:Uncharacterized protein n=1 Tax=Oculimacula yallundae TaxID=86028 RepID=A0ABR4CYQ7_9HELO